MAIKEWVTHLPAGPDVKLTDQQDLVDDSYPGAGDGDLTRTSQIHTVRDIADYCAKKIGSDLEETGTILERVRVLETTGAVDTTAIHKATAGEISSMPEKTTPVDADLLVIEDSEDENAKKRVQIGNLVVGGGTLDRLLVFSDDTELATTSTSYDVMKQFRILLDPEKTPTSWRLIAEIWSPDIGEYATSVECQLSIGYGEGSYDEAEESASYTSGGGVVYIDLPITENEPTDTLLDAMILLKITGTGTAYIQYTDLYAIYGEEEIPEW